MSGGVTIMEQRFYEGTMKDIMDSFRKICKKQEEEAETLKYRLK